MCSFISSQLWRQKRSWLSHCSRSWSCLWRSSWDWAESLKMLISWVMLLLVSCLEPSLPGLWWVSLYRSQEIKIFQNRGISNLVKRLFNDCRLSLFWLSVCLSVSFNSLSVFPSSFIVLCLSSMSLRMSVVVYHWRHIYIWSLLANHTDRLSLIKVSLVLLVCIYSQPLRQPASLSFCVCLFGQLINCCLVNSLLSD